MTEVIYDTAYPWLESGRAKEVAESSDKNSETLYYTCCGLLTHLQLTHLVMGERWWGDRYQALMNQKPDDSQDPKIKELAIQRLSVLCDHAKGTTEKLGTMHNGLQEWVNNVLNEYSEDLLDYLLKVMDYYRWQILKEFAKLVMLFDDHDDLDCKDVPLEWQRVRAVLHPGPSDE